MQLADFLNISASAPVLTKRLMGRAREPPEEVAKRVARAKQGEPKGDHVIHIFNEGTREGGALMVAGALLGQLKYSLWLSPTPGASVHALTSGIIAEQSAALREDAHGFAPHVTLCPSFACNQRDAIMA